MPVCEFGRSHILLSCDGSQSSQEQVQLAAIRELRLEQSTLSYLRLSGVGLQPHGKDFGRRRVSLELKVKELEKRVPVLCWTRGCHTKRVRLRVIKGKCGSDTP